MSTKLKKYLFLIPTLFVMLINCLCYGQVIFSANAIDYTEYFKSPDESDLLSHFDFTDPENVISTVKNYHPNYPSSYFSNYYYCVYLTPDEYNKYSSGSPYNFTIKCIFTDSSDITNSTNFYILNKTRLTVNLHFSSSNNFSLSTGFDDHYDKYFIYYKNTGSFIDENTSSIKYIFIGDDRINYCDNNIYYYQYSNIDNFPFFYDYEASQSALNVNVVFNPELSGEVDRSVTLDDGSTALRDSITMVVYNHSRFDIQYKMDIYRKEDLSEFATVAPGVYPVFTYYEKDWVYGNSLDNNADFWNKTEKQNKATSQHLIWSGRSDIVSFNFSQLPLSEGVNYTVVVRATRNDYKFPSEIVADYLEEPDPGRYQVSQSEVVFRSDFSMKQYSDVKYDHSDNSNGVLPFQGKDDKQQYENSYYAKEDDSGNVDYEGKDVYNDPDSWYNDKFNHDINHDKSYPGLVGDKESGGSSDGTFTSFASSFSNYFQFLAYIFNYFPVGIKNVFLIGFVGIMAVVLLKVVFKS